MYFAYYNTKPRNEAKPPRLQLAGLFIEVDILPRMNNATVVVLSCNGYPLWSSRKLVLRCASRYLARDATG